jgi:hypothetical protein
MPAPYCPHAVDPEGLSLGVHGIQKVTRDLYSPVYALVGSVGLGMVECERYIRPAKIHITTAEVPARVESVGFPYQEVVLS